MFSGMKLGDRVLIDGRYCSVIRISTARFWVEIDSQEVKFSRHTGKEYDGHRQAVPFAFSGGGIGFFIAAVLGR